MMSVLSLMMTAFLSVGFISCGDDDGGSGISGMTTAEIQALLQGKWAVSGQYELNEQWIYGVEKDKNEEKGSYTGSIEFKLDGTYRFESYDEEGDSIHLGEVLPSWGKYTILKKNGKTYIAVETYDSYHDEMLFEIVTLNKNSIKLVLTDSGKGNEGRYEWSYYMTIIGG